MRRSWQGSNPRRPNPEEQGMPTLTTRPRQENRRGHGGPLGHGGRDSDMVSYYRDGDEGSGRV